VTDRWDADEPPVTVQGVAIRVKLAHPPASLPDAVRAAWTAGGRPVRVGGHAATGVTFVEIDSAASGPEAMLCAVTGLRAFAASVGGSALVRGAPPEVRAAIDVWGPSGDSLDLMRRVKERFDPTRTLSPGRFVGGI
jgi:glycolate oxidase FAD binding subunit